MNGIESIFKLLHYFEIAGKNTKYIFGVLHTV